MGNPRSQLCSGGNSMRVFARGTFICVALVGAVAVLGFYPGTASALSQQEIDHAYNECANGEGDSRRIIDYCNLAIGSGDLNRRELAIAFTGRGFQQLRSNRHHDAIKSFGDAIYHDPQYADAYFHRGWTKRDLGYDRDALGDFQLAYRYDPDPDFLKAIRKTSRYLQEEQDRQQRAARQYSLIYKGLYCRRVQKDSVFTPANEIFVNVVVVDANGRPHSSTLPGRGKFYKNMKNGSKRSGNGRRLWTGPSQPLTLQVTMWEYDDGGAVVEQLTKAAKDFALTRGAGTLARYADQRGVMNSVAQAGRAAANTPIKKVDLSAQLAKHLSSLPNALFGTDNDLIGHIGIVNVYPGNRGKPLRQAGFTYDFSTVFRRGGADCRVYFQFQ